MRDPERKILVWDLPTRFFHWLVVALVIAAYGTLQLNWMQWHAWAGDGVLSLVLFRLLWGFFGSEAARFASFITAPATALGHLAQTLRREPDRYAGHNPAGGWMVLVLLALLLGETLSGLFVANDVADAGPLTELTPAPIANAITALHWIFWDALLAAVALHLLAILAYAVVKRHNLVLGMITGRKSLPANIPPPRMASAARGIILLTCSGLAAAALATFL